MPRLPAEWEPQSAVMLTWPHRGTDWAPRLDEVEPLYAGLAALITRYQRVLLICRDSSHRAGVNRLLTETGANPRRILFALAASNDSWARDHGPIAVFEDGRPRLLDFRFNGWGGKFPAELDDLITTQLLGTGLFVGAELTRSQLVLEGGAIETDGRGTLLATRRTLVDDNRNPDWTRQGIEAELARHLGIERFLWLEHGALSGDDTDGHIDTLARFCAPDTICYVRCDDESDPDLAELASMEQELRSLTRADGEPYRLVPLPHPSPVQDAGGRRLPASYANFLVINGAVLVPVYGDPADTIAADRLQRLFPTRKILSIDCRPLIRQGGSLHCVTMQLPAALQLGPE
ncbi:MAG: agmatine deiminase family protein [Pseudomonadota bacterium]|nr:agmatine deiminase family protein [Pseudomonadota bacterium]